MVVVTILLAILLTADFRFRHAAAETPDPTLLNSPTVATLSLEEPLRLIQEARRAYSRVRDYECTLIKRERLANGTLPPETVMLMQIRTEPHSVRLVWQEPAEVTGQEAVFVTGRNQGKIRARAAGALSLIGFVSLDPRSPRAMGTSQYPMSGAGVGTLIERFGDSWERESRNQTARVKIDLGEFSGRSCIRVEVEHQEPGEGLIFGRCVVWFDQVTSLPVRVENYDWAGELAEVFSFTGMKLNIGFADAVFEK